MDVLMCHLALVCAWSTTLDQIETDIGSMAGDAEPMLF